MTQRIHRACNKLLFSLLILTLVSQSFGAHPFRPRAEYAGCAHWIREKFAQQGLGVTFGFEPADTPIIGSRISPTKEIVLSVAKPHLSLRLWYGTTFSRHFYLTGNDGVKAIFEQKMVARTVYDLDTSTQSTKLIPHPFTVNLIKAMALHELWHAVNRDLESRYAYKKKLDLVHTQGPRSKDILLKAFFCEQERLADRFVVLSKERALIYAVMQYFELTKNYTDRTGPHDSHPCDTERYEYFKKELAKLDQIEKPATKSLLLKIM